MDSINYDKGDETQYDMFYCAYEWPDILRGPIEAVIIDKYLGMRKGIVIFTGIVFAGQLTASIGAYFNIFELMIFGRLLLGCGFGPASSVTSAIAIVWFSEKR